MILLVAAALLCSVGAFQPINQLKRIRNCRLEKVITPPHSTVPSHRKLHQRQGQRSRHSEVITSLWVLPWLPFSPPAPPAKKETDIRYERKEALLQILSQSPSNEATSPQLTSKILASIRDLEPYCPFSASSVDATSSALSTSSSSLASPVLQELAGTWELVWTAQDPQSPELSGNNNDLLANVSKLRAWINPLENQSYSNNPLGASSILSSDENSNNDNAATSEGNGVSGRANPILPTNIQQRLEDWGIIGVNDFNDSKYQQDSTEVPELTKQQTGDEIINKGEGSVTSTQTIILQQGIVRNVVSVPLPSYLNGSNNQKGKQRRATLTVNVSFQPNLKDDRRIDVKFQSCRLVFPNILSNIIPKLFQKNGDNRISSNSSSNNNKHPLDVTIPLGIIGPTGWLRTTFIDESMRITRGHKGSVFVLRRAGSRKSGGSQ